MIITPAYKALNKQLHDSSPGYGTSGHYWREMVRELSNWGRKSILDFGCGKATLAKSLGPAYRVTNYDPCIPGLDSAPEPHDVVVCGDVMEHVEPELVGNVLKEIRRVTKDKAFFVIALKPANKTLADGRNAHICLLSQHQWTRQLTDAGFTIEQQSEAHPDTYNAWFICR
jgi:2-polyprenyl-3-methyl-5-hydroxy-6-metoxy-1,4-benzoquinol methylase